MSKISRPLTVALLLLAAGCLPSLHSIYKPDDLVFDKNILGQWKQEKSPETWDFTQRDKTSYQLVYTDKQGRSGRFIAHVCQVEKTMFLDLFPEKDDVTGAEFYKYHLMPIHTIYMVKTTSPQLTLVSIDLNWLNKYLDEDPSALAHTNVRKQKLITASTEELQRFLLDHRDRFTGEIRLVRPEAEAVEVAK